MNGMMTYRQLPLPAAPPALWRGAPRLRARFAESVFERSRISAWETDGGSLGPDSSLFQRLAAAHRSREGSHAARSARLSMTASAPLSETGRPRLYP